MSDRGTQMFAEKEIQNIVQKLIENGYRVGEIKEIIREVYEEKERHTEKGEGRIQ